MQKKHANYILNYPQLPPGIELFDIPAARQDHSVKV